MVAARVDRPLLSAALPSGGSRPLTLIPRFVAQICNLLYRCCIAELYSAEGSNGSAGGSRPTASRLQIGDTAQRGGAASKTECACPRVPSPGAAMREGNLCEGAILSPRPRRTSCGRGRPHSERFALPFSNSANLEKPSAAQGLPASERTNSALRKICAVCDELDNTDRLRICATSRPSVWPACGDLRG